MKNFFMLLSLFSLGLSLRALNILEDTFIAVVSLVACVACLVAYFYISESNKINNL